MKNGTALLDAATAAPKPILDLDTLKPGVPLRITNVGWEDYLEFLEIIGDRPFRTSYADGEYEIYMPTMTHGSWVSIIGRLIQVLAEELDLPIRSLDPVTVKREDIRKGLEPDRWFYFDNEPKVQSRMDVDFDVDPPPDLALEAEVTTAVGRRMSIYAALRVPEVWRYRDDALTISQLAGAGEYADVERSRFFPHVPLSELVRFVHLFHQMGERELIKSFRKWVREQIAAAWQVSE